MAKLKTARIQPGVSDTTQAVVRAEYLKRIFDEFPKVIWAASSRSMAVSFTQDYAMEPCDHESELYLHLLENPEKIDGLMTAGTAKDSSRLYKLVNSRTRGFKTRMNRRHARILKQYRDGDCLYVDQVVRPEEIRATKISRRRLGEIEKGA